MQNIKRQVIKRVLPGIVVPALCGTAAAHTISQDVWNGVSGPYSGSSVSVDFSTMPREPVSGLPRVVPDGVSSLTFSTGSSLNSYITRAPAPEEFAVDYYWGDPNDAIEVELSNPDVPGPNGTELPGSTLTVSFGYADWSPGGCAAEKGETASVTVNGNTYQTNGNPCSLASGTGDLIFKNGVLEAGTGVGWTETTVPLPGGAWLLGGGLLGLGGIGRRKIKTLAHQ